MSKSKFPKSVSFNLKNPNDLRILEHVKRRNFSGYVKNLILHDIEATQKTTSQSKIAPQSKLERLQSELKHFNQRCESSTDTKPHN